MIGSAYPTEPKGKSLDPQYRAAYGVSPPIQYQELLACYIAAQRPIVFRQ